MAEKKQKIKTIYIRFTAAIIAIILLQTVIFSLVIAANSVVSSINRSSEDVLQQYASKRSMALETEMLRKWSDIGAYAELANQLMTEKIDEAGIHISDVFSNEALLNSFTEDISAELLDILRTKNVNGAYMILCSSAERPDTEKEQRLKGVYIADSDPDDVPEDNSDIIMLKGNSTISSRYNIPLDMKWSTVFSNDLNEISDLDFFFEPVCAAYDNPEIPAEQLGCWSRHFTLTSSGNHSYNLIAYSIPLSCDGQVYGVIGISISVEHITEMLPASEIDDHGHGSYMLIRSKDYAKGRKSFSAEVEAVSGGIMADMASPDDTLRFSDVQDSDILHEIKNINVNNTSIYCAADAIKLYDDSITCYANDWILLAAIDGDDLFETSHLLTSKLILSFLLSFSICTLLGILLSIFVLKPVRLLSDDAENITESSSAPLRSNLGTEFNSISSALYELSTERNFYAKELKSEKERHLILLRAAKCRVFEYDLIEDTFTIYRFSNNSERNSRHKNYRKLVTDGKVCAAEDIPLMLKFTEGKTDEEFQLRIYEKNGELRWKTIVSRPVTDEDGNIIRMVACSSDITEEKLEEEKRIAREHLDKVTGFYSNEYGRMLVKKSIIENEGTDYNITIFSLKNVNDYIQLHGAYFFDGIIEEIGNILRMFSTSHDIIWRKSISEIAVYTSCPEYEQYHSDISTALDYISKIYFDEEEKNFICQAGVSENPHGTTFREALDKAVQAECAAEMPIYPDICYYSDINLDVNTRAALISTTYSQSSADLNTIKSGFIVTENIISYSLNMLENAKLINDALRLVFSKTGYSLGLDRIIMYEINHDFMSVNIFCQWCRYELDGLDKSTIRLEKHDFDKMLAVSKGQDMVVLDTDYHSGSDAVNDIISGFREDRKMVIIPAIENGRLVGCISARLIDDEISDDTLFKLKEIAKITVTHILKSKTSDASKAKSDFLSSMSHEIRTPMNAIMGMTAIALHNDDISEETRDCLNKIDSSSKYLLELINDILDMSRIESGKITVENAYLNMNSIIEQAEIINRTRIEENGNKFIIRCRIDEPRLIGDSMKLRQVLVNILGNASKFTKNGTVTLSVTQEKKKNSNMTFIRFSVKDTGIGISEENLSRIFNSFEQADSSTSRKYGGTGLGLSISSNYVRLMGGRLEVRSKEGEGSEFYFTLPMRKASPSEIPAPEKAAAKPVDFTTKTVLLAEDDELNTEIAKTLLEADGLTVETAENGQQALDMYKASEPNYYDVILMDIRMPVMDGLEAAKLIRRSERTDASSVPIIAMTANAFDDDMKKSVECGMNGHLSKPIDMNRIREVLTKIWSE